MAEYYVTGESMKLGARPRDLMRWFSKWRRKDGVGRYNDIKRPVDPKATYEVTLGQLFDLRLASIAGWQALGQAYEVEQRHKEEIKWIDRFYKDYRPLPEPGAAVGGYPWERDEDEDDEA